MDFLSLQSEYDSYKEYIENTNNTMKSVRTFFINTQRSLSEYATSTENSLNELFNNLMKYDNRSTHIKKFFEFFRLFEKHLLKLTTLSKKIYSELVVPTNDFEKYLIEENNYHLQRLQKLITNTINQKKKYEIIKHSYFDVCKQAENQEKVLVKEMTKNSHNEEAINTQNEILTKLRVESQEECLRYKIEHKVTNDLYNENNKKYFPLINDLKDNEEKRINFLSFHLEKYINLLKEQSISLNNVIVGLNEEELRKKNLVKIKLDEDIKLYQEKFNFVYKQNCRFINEDFILYDIYRRNIEAIIKNTNKIIRNNMNNPFESSVIDYNPNIYNFESQKISLDQNDQIIYSHLFTDSPYNVNQKLFSSFGKKILNDEQFAESILDKMLGEIFQPKIYYKFNDFQQFDKLSQILIDICLNKEVQNGSSFQMNFGIIYIAEKTFYQDNTTKKRLYMTRSISDNFENYKNKHFWKKLLQDKVKNSLKKLTDKALDDELKQIQKKQKNRLQKIQGAVKYILDTGTGARNMSKLREKKEKIIINKELMNILKEFLYHLSSFNVDMPSSNDILMEIANEYSLTKEHINFLVSYLNSNMYSIKRIALEQKENISILIPKKLNSKNNLIILGNKYKLTNNTKLKRLYLILSCCFMFLQPKDYINYMCVNKFIYQNSEKVIYKYIFLKTLNKSYQIDLGIIEKHIGMWYYYTNYDKTKYNYKEILKNALEKKSELKFLETINMDVIRTFFESDQEIKREKLKNILICISVIYPSVGYCQGMNYICQFLLEICNSDEEKTFDTYSLILCKTDYCNLICNDFENMKKYFYVFERLISIYLPELSTVIRRNNVNASFYISPWFITLFTHSFKENHTKILLRVFDMFIFDGWECIIRIGLMLLKHYESDLIEMKFEELLHFLINDLKEKYDFFNNNNYDKFIEMYKDMKVPKGLMCNIENEYGLDKKVQEIKKRKEIIEKEQKEELYV